MRISDRFGPEYADIDHHSFAEWIYQSSDVEPFLGQDLYLKLLETFLCGYSETYEKIGIEILNFMRNKCRVYCHCSGLKSESILPMGHDKEYGLDKFQVIKYRTPLSCLSLCLECNSHWYMCMETLKDDYHCLRLTEEQLENINHNGWPSMFDINNDWIDVDFIELNGCSQLEWQLRTNEPRKYIYGLPSSAENLDLSGSLVIDDDLDGIEKLISLKHLDLSGTKITDRIASIIERLDLLQSIDLSNTNITDITYEAISKNFNLRSIRLNDTLVSGKIGLGQKYFVNIEEMSLYNTSFCDDAMKVLAMCSNMRHLSLTNSKVSDVGLEFIKSLVELEELNLAGLNITDIGIVNLASLKNLKKCSLVGTGVSINIIDTLSKLKCLEKLGLSGTNISPQRFNDFKNILPSLKEIY